MTRAGKHSRWARIERSLPALLVGVMIGVGVVALAVLSNERGTDPPLSELVGRGDPGPVHVHGLGINPADGSLLIATHTGTYRVAEGEKTPKLVGDNRQDTMGFTVAGPDHFLGSGHPDPNDARERGLPSQLGLIESRDAGRTWRTISLSGEADFHVLRYSAERVYGYDASNDRLLVSRDSGRTWRPAARPGVLVDLAVDPGDSRRVIAATKEGLFVSAEEGRRWTALPERAGLLAWPSPDRIFLVSGAGRVLMSHDPRAAWAAVGDVGGAPASFLARSATELYVALHDGRVKVSVDGGRTWRLRAAP